VDPISATTLSSPSTGVAATNALADLRSEDFFQLLITQLTNQDPFEPTENEDLLRQISSIRDIELSTVLTNSLHLLTGQQRFASASSLIGRHITGLPDADGAVMRGLVVGIRFEADGQPMLQLSNGVEIAVDQVASIESAERAAEALIGQTIVGIDQREPSEAEVVEGRVTAVRVGDGGEVMLELDTGADLRFRDYVSISSDET
jgi:flagellar basal-body rod modification protein FlgD